MAKRRMFSKEIVRSDAFLDLPVSSRELYFQLGMDTDDRGYIPNAKSVIRLIGANQGDLEPLITKGFLMIRGDTLILQKHFEINNIIRHDRFHETEYLEDLKKLFIKENGSYTEDEKQGKSMVSVLGIPNDNQKPTDTNTILIQNNSKSNSYSDSNSIQVYSQILVKILIDSNYIESKSLDEEEVKLIVIEPLLKNGIKSTELKEKINNFIKYIEYKDLDDISNKANYLKEYLDKDSDDLPF